MKITIDLKKFFYCEHSSLDKVYFRINFGLYKYLKYHSEIFKISNFYISSTIIKNTFIHQYSSIYYNSY